MVNIVMDEKVSTKIATQRAEKNQISFYQRSNTFYPGATVRKTPLSKHEVKPLVFVGINGR